MRQSKAIFASQRDTIGRIHDRMDYIFLHREGHLSAQLVGHGRDVVVSQNTHLYSSRLNIESRNSVCPLLLELQESWEAEQSSGTFLTPGEEEGDESFITYIINI